ncbi:SRPBCC family protein [Vampirovibrio sp.]|uniref:SRPBCC family protein n=1 Tax=Vampirovibrio sp. TaxID=2717857 RepID=UPI0035930F6C
MFVTSLRLHARQALLLGHCFTLGAFLMGLLLVGSVAQAESAEWQTLKQGNVIVKQYTAPNTVPSVEAKILIAKSPETVWTVVSDQKTLLSQERKVKRLQVLSKTGNKQTVAFTVLMTHLLPSFNYILSQELSPPHSLTFHRVSGSFRDIQGSWRLTPADNGTKTILSYNLKLDPGPLVPHAMILAAVKSDLPSFMRNAKASINKNTP